MSNCDILERRQTFTHFLPNDLSPKLTNFIQVGVFNFSMFLHKSVVSLPLVPIAVVTTAKRTAGILQNCSKSAFCGSSLPSSLHAPLSMQMSHASKNGIAHQQYNGEEADVTVVILSAARTPIGSFRGKLASVPATHLGSIAIKEAVSRAGLQANDIQEVFMGHVLQASAGQAPARQATLGAGLAESTICTTINKVCASGMKSIMLAVQSLKLGDQQVIVAGGMESMSQAPFYLPRGEIPYGGTKVINSIESDGLTDVYNKVHMGTCGENTARKYGFSREDQDKYAADSYTKARAAVKSGLFRKEIVPVTVKSARGPEVVVEDDEEPNNYRPEKMATLKPSFDAKSGTITAANASKLNDGAAACVLTTLRHAKQSGLKPLAEVVNYADAAVAPIDFPIAPVFAVNKLLQRAGVSKDEVSLWEINEAFSCVVLACVQDLGIDMAKVNVNGGAVALGHPIGCSGARITNHLVHQLKPGELGVAAICNGGGGASAILIRKM